MAEFEQTGSFHNPRLATLKNHNIQLSNWSLMYTTKTTPRVNESSLYTCVCARVSIFMYMYRDTVNEWLRYGLVAGRDGLTHNMLSEIHNHWKYAEAVRIKCIGVPTVDMKNICNQLEVYVCLYSSNSFASYYGLPCLLKKQLWLY